MSRRGWTRLSGSSFLLVAVAITVFGAGIGAATTLSVTSRQLTVVNNGAVPPTPTPAPSPSPTPTPTPTPTSACTVTLRGASSTATSSLAGTVLTLTKPAGVVAGDFMIAQVTIESGTGGTILAPVGWTLIRRDNHSSNLGIATYRRFAGALEPASWAWTLNNKKASGGIIAYQGVNATTPVNASGASSAASGTPTAPSVTTTVPNTQLLAFFASKNNVSHPQPTGMTRRYLTSSTDGFNSSANDQPRAAAGATGTRTSAFSGEWVAQSVALRSSCS